MLPKILKNCPSIKAGDGEVILAAPLQGRLFAAMEGEMLHRFDAPLAERPSESFNNLGGNSLWPAPEGGEYAFNYPADGGPWRVQDGINKTPSVLFPCGMEKKIELENRKGVSATVIHRRKLRFPEYGFGKKYALKSIVYASCDSLELASPLSPEEFLLSSWSLEQFDLTPHAFAFGTVSGKINGDFYGDPQPFLTRKDNSFRFDFTAPEKLQIGLPESIAPGMVGAYLPERELAVIRRIVCADAGKRINFSDNNQPQGVYSAADAYSVFFGAKLNFFELEALAPVRIKAGRVTGSAMTCETHFYRGPRERIAALLQNEFHFNTEVFCHE